MTSCSTPGTFIASHAPQRNGRGQKTAASKFYELRDILRSPAFTLMGDDRKHRVCLSE